MKTCTLCVLLFSILKLSYGDYEIGVGIADVTGPIVEIAFMGYGSFSQTGTGLHLRQWARSFVINDGNSAIVFVSVDVGMIGDGLRMAVIKKLEPLYGSLYNDDNVIISGTHTHSAPGGFLMHTLFDLPIKGFSSETFNALVDGIVKSIVKAHKCRKRGKIFLIKGELDNANINRSPTSYLKNPEEERKLYKKDTDTEMVQLKFISSDGNPLGVINWFPIHPTSMNNTNTLVSSDNVGYASILFEQKLNPKAAPGRGIFVASFASSNLGDVSPNIKGPKCSKTGLPCETFHSTCPGKNNQCIASGPGNNMFESTAIIAERLFEKAWELWLDPSSEEVAGPIKIVHQYVDMSKAEAQIVTNEGEIVTVKGCVPAMGYSFAGGTIDGPGAFSFEQGTTSTNPMWNLVTNLLAAPTAEDIRCHAPKPILLATGRMKFPYDWQPSIVSTQLALIGNIALVAVPGEFTTMAGRRMKRMVRSIMEEEGIGNPTAIIAGLCNTYSDYITTYEEYQPQRYEAASTIFGPHTLTLYLNQYRILLLSILKGTPLGKGPKPTDLLTKKMITFITPVIYDLPKTGFRFGSVLDQPPLEVAPNNVVTARFVSGNPRNNLMHGETFCSIERLLHSNVWEVEATDANWETKIYWKRTNVVLGQSVIVVEWTVPANIRSGIYRIKHFGYYKNMIFGILPYSGATRSFKVINNITSFDPFFSSYEKS